MCQSPRETIHWDSDIPFPEFLPRRYFLPHALGHKVAVGLGRAQNGSARLYRDAGGLDPGNVAERLWLGPNSVTWVLSGDEHVAEYVAPPNVVSSPNSDLAEMLVSGEIDAAIGVGAHDSPDIKPLFPEAAAADADWFNSTGIYPISHMLVAKNEHLESNAWLAGELYSLFQSAKRPYLEFLHSGATLSPADQALMAMANIVGDDPIPYGLDSARKTIETFIGFNVDQQVIPDWVGVDEVFAPV